MKKSAVFPVAFLLMASGCSNAQPASSMNASSSQASASQFALSSSSAMQTSSQAEDKGESHAVVAYFSATGNTEQAARYIAGLTGAQTFVITPEQPYTPEDLAYGDADSRVYQEHDNPDLQEVALTSVEVPDWDSFDVVYLGYPIWWGTSAWPVDTFVKANDFSGKTVYPFATSASSPIGSSGSDLAALAKTGQWENAVRFPSSVSEQEVRQWLVSIGAIDQ